MFLVQTLTVITEALRQVFNEAYPVADFQDLYISIEYPYTEQAYPGVWVNFEPVGTISRGGIDNYMFPPTVVTSESIPNDLYRYRFSGYASYTIGTFTSFQRARLFDELVRTFMVNQDPSVMGFRDYIESNNYIALNMDFDNTAIRGLSESQGTPWGTNDYIYEATLAMELVGEFVSDQLYGELINLSEVEITGTAENPDGTLTQFSESVDIAT